jgi:hypothetical protein
MSYPMNLNPTPRRFEVRHKDYKENPNGVHMVLTLRGGKTIDAKHNGRLVYVMTAGHFYIVDPANGGYAVAEVERGLIAGLCIGHIPESV